MSRAFVILLLTCWASVGLAEDTSAVKFPSPDGRFALRVADFKVDLIETPSGKVMLDLDTLWVDREDERNKDEPVLVWSNDSKWVAYGTRTLQSGSTKVYFWDDSAFKELALPPKAQLHNLSVLPRCLPCEALSLAQAASGNFASSS